MEFLRTLTREFDVGERAVIDVENRSGHVSVRGEETTRARVEVLARLWAETDREADDQFELVERGVRQEGDRIVVRAPALLRPTGFLGLLTRGPRIDYQLTVPRATGGQITNRSGPTEATSISGPLRIESSSGRTSVSRIDKDTTIISRSGSVQADAIGGALVIESRSGSVRVRDCKGSLSIDSRSGTQQIEGVGGDARVHSRSGSLAIVDVGGALSVQSRSGAVRYEGGIRAPFDFDITSGSVQIALDPDSVFFLDAEAASGSARSEFTVRSGDAAARDGPTLRVRTLSGSILIVPR
jgi:DUF4097 and DUF4098 domain-containing protein YvlB